MRYWFDTEFMEDGRVIELLSIGIVAEDGRELYAESSEADLSHANEWVVQNVLPHLWSRQQDVLCQLFGRMVDLPEGWPMFAMDVKQLAVDLGNARIPEQRGTQHHALDDARWNRDAWYWLKRLSGHGVG